MSQSDTKAKPPRHKGCGGKLKPASNRRQGDRPFMQCSTCGSIVRIRIGGES